LLREATKHQGRRTDFDDNITEVGKQKTGTSKSYTLDRIAREDPDLYEQVAADPKMPKPRLII